MNQQRWRYNFRNRHGFTDQVDAAFDRLWAERWPDVGRAPGHQRMTETTVSDIDVNGVTLRVHQAGDPANPTVMLCHGFPELASLVASSDGTAGRCRVPRLAPDQRGYGHSSRADATSPPTGSEDLTDDLLGLLDHFGKDDAMFVGHDWGALIVWDLARLHPQRVRSGRRRQRAVRAVAGAADAADEDALRRPLLLHPVLPGAGRRRGRARRQHRTTRWPR